MRALLFLSLFVLACSPAENKVEPEVKDSLVEHTEYIPIENDYYYQITNNKTGEVMELNQKDYLNSEYLNNSEYSIKEVTHAR